MHNDPYRISRNLAAHDKLIRHYLEEHEREWRELTGLRRLVVHLRAEWRAWRYAAEHGKLDYDPRNLY